MTVQVVRTETMAWVEAAAIPMAGIMALEVASALAEAEALGVALNISMKLVTVHIQRPSMLGGKNH